MNNNLSAGTVTANTATAIEITNLTTGAKYVHILVLGVGTNTESNILTISMPNDIYYFDDFEAYAQDTHIPTSLSDITTPQMYIKYNGGNQNNQKIILSSNKKVLQTSGTYSTGLDIRINLPSTISSGIAVFEADITPINFGSSWYNAELILGEKNTEKRPINIAIDNDSNKFFAQPLVPDVKQISEIVCIYKTIHHARIEIDLTNQKYDYCVDGVKANRTKISFLCQNLNWFGIYNGGGTANFDNVKFYATPSLSLTHTITYNANGGGGEMTPGVATDNTAFTLPQNSFTPPLGKRFKEWAIGGIDETRVAAGSSHVFTNPTTVYAIWDDIYSIHTQFTANGTLSGNNRNASSGETVTITATPNYGYKIKSIKILKASNNFDITNSVNYNSTGNTFTMPNYAVKVFVEFEKIIPSAKTIYKIVSYNDNVHTKNTSGDMIITCYGELSKLTELTIKGKTIPKNCYSLKSGSTILTLKKEYLNTLEEETYTIKFIYTDGEATANFKIKKQDKNNLNEKGLFVSTGDSSLILLYTLMTLILGSFFVIFTINKRNKKV